MLFFTLVAAELTQGWKAIFFENFFNEIRLPQNHAGGLQTASFLLFTIALAIAALALALYFFIAPSLF